MSDPFAAARAQLKASKPHVVTSTATPSKTSTTSASSTSKTDPLAAVRAKLKGSKPTSTTSSTTSSYTNLLIASAHANGHSQPKMWAQNVEAYLATLTSA